MKSKFIKILACMCTIITMFSLNGCGTNKAPDNKANLEEEENTNVKDESSEPMNNNTNNK